MHKFPLYSLTHSFYGASEYETMVNVMCPRNVIDSELLIKVIKKESETFFEQLLSKSIGLLDLAIEYIKSSDPETGNKGLQLLNRLIYRVPSGHRSILSDALLARGIYYAQMRKYRLATNDLKWYDGLDSSQKTTEEMVLGQTLLCLSLYMVRDLHGAKEVLNRLNAMDHLSSIVSKSEFIGFFLLLRKYEPEINYESKNVQFTPKNNDKKGEPFLGSELNCIPKYFHVKLARSERVYAKNFIEEGEIVVVEYPKYFQFSSPFLNCELCGVVEEQLYTCPHCRYRTYCSKLCLDNDWDDHRDECYGYKVGIIPMLEANLLFRLFVQTSKYLAKIMFNFLEEGGILTNSLIAWNFFIEAATSDNGLDTAISTLLTTQPNYNLIQPEKWRQLVGTSFRLAVFIYNDTRIIETYFGLLKLTKNDLINLVAALLMRLNAHIMLKCEREQLLYPVKCHLNSDQEDKRFEATSPMKLADRMSVNAFGYYRINAHADFIDCLNKFNERELQKRPIATRKRHLDSPLSEYINKLINLSLMGGGIDSVSHLINADIIPLIDIERVLCELNSSKRFEQIRNITKYFHQFIDEYFYPASSKRFVRQEKLSLCISLGSFQNVRKPANLQISSLSCGLYLATAISKVNTGCELSIRRGHPHQSFNNNLSLKLFLAGIYGDNLIRSSSSLDATHYSLGLFCGFCEDRVEITPAYGKCFQCGANYYDLLNKNMEFIAYLETEISKTKTQKQASERDLALLYGTYNSFLTMHFTEGHELRIRGVLKFAEFLAIKGFLHHASVVLHSSIFICMDDFCLYKMDIFTNIFKIIQIIMEHYVENIDLRSQIEAPYLTRLLESSLCILRRQERNLRIFVDDEDIFNFCIKQSTNYYIWKQIVNLNYLMPQSVRNYLYAS